MSWSNPNLPPSTVRLPELAPKHNENDDTEVKQKQSSQTQTEVKAKTSVNTVNVHTIDLPQGHKPSIVAEPQPLYPISANVPRFPARHSGIWQSTIDRSRFNARSVYFYILVHFPDNSQLQKSHPWFTPFVGNNYFVFLHYLYIKNHISKYKLWLTE